VGFLDDAKKELGDAVDKPGDTPAAGPMTQPSEPGTPGSDPTHLTGPTGPSDPEEPTRPSDEDVHSVAHGAGAR
jgi:hypothetical protein